MSIVCVRTELFQSRHSLEAVTSYLGPGSPGGRGWDEGVPGVRGEDPGQEGAPGWALGGPDPASCPCHVSLIISLDVTRCGLSWCARVLTSPDAPDPTITRIILEIPGTGPSVGNIRVTSQPQCRPDPSHWAGGRAHSALPGLGFRSCRGVECRLRGVRWSVARVMCAAPASHLTTDKHEAAHRTGPAPGDWRHPIMWGHGAPGSSYHTPGSKYPDRK